MKAIFRKELTDYFNSIRVLVLLGLALGATALALWADYQGIRGAGSEGFIFLRLFTTGGVVSLANFLALFFVPLIAIALGFDAINSERTGGTISRILAQPVYRDSVINGKFLASTATLAIMVTATIMLVAGYGLRMIGVPPNAEEIIRLFIFLVTTIIYGAFWVSLSILFSILFRRIAASMLFSIALWLFLIIFIMIIAPLIANAIVPVVEGKQETLIANAGLNMTLLRFSPNTLFSEATTVLLHPVLLETSLGVIGAISSGQAQYMIASPISLGQSILIVWPHLAGLISLSVICFAISYMLFMRQEIRAT